MTERAQGRTARSWDEIRSQLHTDPARVAQLEKELEDRQRAFRLAEIREGQGVTQQELAERIGITQSRVSKIERGDLATLSVVRSYVEGLGGEVKVVADFGDRSVLIS